MSNVDPILGGVGLSIFVYRFHIGKKRNPGFRGAVIMVRDFEQGSNRELPARDHNVNHC
jgi:hypothetical protein